MSAKKIQLNLGSPIDKEFINKNLSSNKISKTDFNPDLEIFCYNYDLPLEDKDLERTRGVIFHKEELIVPAYPHTTEVVNDTDEMRETLKDIDFDNLFVFKSYEGCLLRLYNFCDTWQLSTNRKLDAFKSRWSSPNTYGDNFVLAIIEEYHRNHDFKEFIGEVEDDKIYKTFLSKLDKDKKYNFLLLNDMSNRIVCNAPSVPTVFHIGTFIDNHLDMDFDINISKPETVSISNIEELTSYITDNIDDRFNQGLVLFGNDNIYKVLNQKYDEYFKVRNNCSSIKFRYLQLRLDHPRAKKLNELYPEYSRDFDEYEEIIYACGKRILSSYIEKFIKREKGITYPKQDYYIMKLCHSNFLADRVNNKIKIDIVMHFLDKQNPSFLNAMIKTFKFDVKKRQKLAEKAREEKKEYEPTEI